MNIIDEYLERTGQTEQELYSGAHQYGMAFIHDLVEQALKEDKKIVWYDDPDQDPLLGLQLYRLESL
jgi:hypothetical protein